MLVTVCGWLTKLKGYLTWLDLFYTARGKRNLNVEDDEEEAVDVDDDCHETEFPPSSLILDSSSDDRTLE